MLIDRLSIAQRQQLEIVRAGELRHRSGADADAAPGVILRSLLAMACFSDTVAFESFDL